MDENNRQRIVECLQKQAVQERIQQSLQRIRRDANVTIRVATALSGFSENQLRYWEERGLLDPIRPGGSKGHRLYSFQELDKLVLISELSKEQFTPADIPADIDKIWHSVISASERLSISPEQQNGQSLLPLQDATIAQSVNQRIESARDSLFWHYFVSQTLHMSLLLLGQGLPPTIMGLVLPLNTTVTPGSIERVEDLSRLGLSLVTRLGKSRSSQTILTERPHFDYSTDFRLLPLTVMTEDQLEEAPADNTMIFLQRRTHPLTLSASVVTIIRRLLKPIYEDVQRSYASFGPRMHDALISSTDLQQTGDILLNGLVEMVVRSGGQTAQGQPRWHFSCILIPKASPLPLHQKSLVVRIQSKYARHKPGETTVTPDAATSSLSLRAFQSGHVIYFPKISRADTSIPFGKAEEEPLRSAIALPIGGENGLPIAVLYVASEEPGAFSENDQRILRILCIMMEELIRTYDLRQQTFQKLAQIMDVPACADWLFKDFLSENDFTRDVEQLLYTVQTGMPEDGTVSNGSSRANQKEAFKQWLSFISIGIDKHSGLANKYGDLVARNLAHRLGLHIQDLLRVTLKEYMQCKLYYISTERFYILLKDIPLEQTCVTAERLRQALAGSYQVDALKLSTDDPSRTENLLELPDTTVRLGAISYSSEKLKEIFNQHPPDDATIEVRSIINAALGKALDIGRAAGGNIVVAWNHEKRIFEPYH